ncbi:MAG: cysteine rich repeat-containing protein [Gallionella sp.]|jgi:hypothetical protein
MNALKTSIFVALIILLIEGPAAAQGMGTGPVAKQCASDIQKFCTDKQHGHGEVRACLESQKDKVSPACKEALETTGGGRGKNQQ